MRFRPAAAIAVAVMAGLALGGLAAPAPAAVETAASQARAVPALHWTGCGNGFQCAKLRLPLDYDRPDGDSIGVSVIRLPAAVPQQRLGALFLNPGGPGGSGVDVVRGIAHYLPLEMRARFDIVGFDPRGILRSTPLRCYSTFRQAIRELAPYAYPVTRRQENRWIASDKALARACRSQAGPILRHMSTADVARDMDAVRRAMGDPQLNFLGFSYGSQLGQTYANMFPGRTRAMVIDGVLNPRAWAGAGPRGARVPVGTRLRSAEGAQKTLREFFRLCDAAGPTCKFSGESRRRFAHLVRGIEPRKVGLRRSDLIGITLGALYSPTVWPELAALLRDVESAVSQATIERRLAALRTKLGLAEKRAQYPNYVEGFPGVICSDGDNPQRHAAYRKWADRAQARFGYFGRPWNWVASACAVWPRTAVRDRYTGPWTARTPNPVLVVGNHFDPATPYTGAVTASNLLPNSRLLTYAGWGHTAFFQGNYCVDAAVSSYLTTTTPPAKGTVCPPNGTPFAEPRSQRLQSLRSAAAPALAGTMPITVRRALSGR